jgi:hypothetical protein
LYSSGECAEKRVNAQPRKLGLLLQVPVFLLVHPHAHMAIAFPHGILLSVGSKKYVSP